MNKREIVMVIVGGILVALVVASLMGAFSQTPKTTNGGVETIPPQVDLEKPEGYWYQGEVIGKVREYKGASYYDYHYVMGTVGTYAEVNVIIFSEEGFPAQFTMHISEADDFMVGNDLYNIEGIDSYRGVVRWTR